MTGFGWSAPAVALIVAPLAGVVTVLLARRGLRSRAGDGPAHGVWTAAGARGAAVCAALLAAAGPFVTDETAAPGEILAVAPEPVDGADRTVRWPADAPDARTALEAARASAPANRPTALVLGCDGATLPALGAATALRRSPAIDVSVVSRAAFDDAPTPVAPSAPRIVVPSEATTDVPFAVEFDAGATPFRGGTAVVSAGDLVAAVRLPDGTSRAATEPWALPAGRHVVVARFPDRAPSAAVVDVAGPPSALVVTRDGREPRIGARLRHQGIAVTTTSDVAVDLEAPHDVVVLGPGTGTRASEALAARVAGGSGLLVLGGPGRHGLSRLRGTALEAILPATLPEVPAEAPPPLAPPDPPVRPPATDRPRPEIDDGEREALRVALLLCIDRSGSMAGERLAMAQQAAIAAARTLSPQDRIGVLAFDDDPEWAVPFQSAGDVASIWKRIAALRPGGGTNFHPALRTAYRAMLDEPCPIRHVILLTDGVTRGALFRDMVEEGTAAGITLSTVAIGDGAETNLLALLALWGRGRLYPATDPDRLPQIVTVDTRRFTIAPRDEALRRREADVGARADDAGGDRPAPPDAPAAAPTPDDTPPSAPTTRTPRVARVATFLRGLERETWPPLRHPETLRARGAASEPLVFDGIGAAVVVGRAGAGRVALVAADVATDEAAELWAWPDAGRAFAQLVRSLTPPPPRADRAPTAQFLTLEDGDGAVVVRSPGGGILRLRDPAGGPERVVVCTAAADASTATFAEAAPGDVFVGAFDPAGGGPAVVTVGVASAANGARGEGAAARARRLAARADAPLRDRLPARPEGEPVSRETPAESPFLLAACGLLLVEAAARRRVAA